MPYGTRKRPYLLCLTPGLHWARSSNFCPTSEEERGRREKTARHGEGRPGRDRRSPYRSAPLAGAARVGDTPKQRTAGPGDRPLLSPSAAVVARLESGRPGVATARPAAGAARRRPV